MITRTRVSIYGRCASHHYLGLAGLVGMRHYHCIMAMGVTLDVNMIRTQKRKKKNRDMHDKHGKPKGDCCLYELARHLHATTALVMAMLKKARALSLYIMLSLSLSLSLRLSLSLSLARKDGKT